MSYSKYIKKGGKLYGPYVYHSKRVGDKVVSEYVGKGKDKIIDTKKKNRRLIFFILFLSVISVTLLLFQQASLSGKTVLEINSIYKPNETISGNLNIVLKSGELIPENVKVLVSLNGEKKEYLLQELIDLNTTEGNFYSENVNLTGSGLGFGFAGEKKTPVDVSFKLKINELKPGIIGGIGGIGGGVSEEPTLPEQPTQPAENETETNITEPQTNVTEQPQQNITQEPEQNVTESETPTQANETTTPTEQPTPQEENATQTETPPTEQPATPQETSTSTTKLETTPATEQQIVQEVVNEVLQEQAIETPTEQPESQVAEQQEQPSETAGAGITGAAIGTNFFRRIASKILGIKKFVINGKLALSLRITGMVIQEVEQTTNTSLDEQAQQKIMEKVEEKLKENENNLIIDGIVNIDSEFIYTLENQTAEIIKESVKANGENLSEDILNLKIKDNKAIVTTNYYKSEQGFGQEYMDNKKNSIPINLDKLNLLAQEGTLNVKLVYNNMIIAEASKELSLLMPENITIISNLTTNLTLNITTNATIQTLQYQARLGKPVKWEKNVELEQQDIVKVELPKEATNITVYKIINGTEEQLKEGSLAEVLAVAEKMKQEQTTPEEQPTQPTGNETIPETNITEPQTNITEEPQQNITQEPEQNVTEPETPTQANETATTEQPIPQEGNATEGTFSITGMTISSEAGKISKGITGKAVATEQQQEAIELTIADNATQYKVAYETPAPVSVEKRIEKGKKEIIVNSELNYSSILAYTYVEESLPEKIKVEGAKQTELIDNNNDGLIDEVDWVADVGDKVSIEVLSTDNAVKRTAFSDSYSLGNGSIETTYSLAQKNVLVDGKYVPITQALDMYSDYNNIIYISDNVTSLELKPYYYSGKEKLYLENITSYDVIAHTHIYDNKLNYKYALGIFNFSLLGADKVGFEVTGSGINVDGNSLTSGGITIDFSDIAENYTLDLNPNYVEISGNFSNDLYLDPSISYLPNATGSSGWYENGPGSTWTWSECDATAYTAANLNNISIDDANSVSVSAIGSIPFNPASTCHRLAINISETNLDVTNITVLAKHSVTLTLGSALNTLALYIGNVTGKSWTQLATQSSPTSGTTYTQSGSINANANQFVNSTTGKNLVYVLLFGVGTADENAQLSMPHKNFFVQLNVTYTPDTTYPLVFLKNPGNNTETNNATVYFGANFTDEIALKNSTLYIWNSTNSIISNSENRTITGTVNQTNISVSLPYGGNFSWNYLACDESSNCNFNNTNWSLSYNPSKIDLDLINPATGTIRINVTANLSFGIIVNVSCSSVDCNNIEVSLVSRPYGTQDSPGLSCKHLVDNGINTSGVYWIKPQSYSSPVQVYCDMETQGGGWTAIMNPASSISQTGNYSLNSTMDIYTSSPTGCNVREVVLAANDSKWVYAYVHLAAECSVYVQLNWTNIINATEVLVMAVGNGQTASNGSNNGYVNLNGANIVVSKNNSVNFALTNQSCGTDNCWYTDSFRDSSVPIKQSFSGNLTIKAGGQGNNLDWGAEGSIWGIMVRENQSYNFTSTTSGDKPFYTNDTNPRTINLNVSQSQLVTFWVNATGTINETYKFFIYANKTGNPVDSNLTATWNVSIQAASVSDTSKPTFTSIATNLTQSRSYAIVNENVNFTVNVTDDTLTDSAWLYHDFNLTDKQQRASTSNTNYYLFGSRLYRGQTFRFNQTYYLRAMCYNISYQSGTKADIFLDLYATSSGLPTGTNLTRATISNSLITSSQLTHCVNFTNTKQLSADAYYTVVASSPSSSSVNTYRLRRGNNVYEGLSVVSTNSGGSYSSSTNDLVFNATAGSFDWLNESIIPVNLVQNNVSQVKQLFWARDTSFNYKWCANDSSGNSNCSSAYSLDVKANSTADSIFPQGNILSPPNATKVNGNVTLDGNASDTQGVSYASIQYSNATTSWTNISGCEATITPYDCMWNTALFSNTSTGYDIRIVPCDTSGNCNTTTIAKSYFIDRKIPVDAIFVIYPAGQASIRNSQNITLKINVTDSSGAGINTTGVFTDSTLLNGTANSTMNLESGSASTGNYSLWGISVNISNANTGLQQVLFHAYDNATPTNNLLTSSFQVQIDNNNPTYNSSSLSHSPTGIIYINENVTFQVNALDNLNLSSFIFSNNFTGTWINASRINFTGVETDDYASNVTYDMQAGGYQYFFLIYDDAGNENKTEANNITIISTGATLTINLINPADELNLTTANVTFSYNYSGGQAGACNLYTDDILNTTTSNPTFNITSNFQQNFSNGYYSWFVRCNNSDNFDFDSETRAFNISIAAVTDNEYPQFSSFLDNNATYSGQLARFNVTITSTNGTVQLNLNATNYTASNLSATIFNVTINLTATGNYNYSWNSWGNGTSNNYNVSSLRWFSVNSTPADTTPPAFTDISNNKSFIYNTQGIASDFNATDASGISSYFINWTEKFNISSNNGLLQNTTTLGAGIYRINVSANDTSGNTGFLIYTIEVNKSGSNVTIYIDGLSQNKSVYNGTKVWLNATLISGDTGNIYLYNNQSLINNATIFPAANQTNFTNPGFYNISAWYQGSENYTENWSKILFVNVSQTPDTIAPTINLTSPSDTSTSTVASLPATLGFQFIASDTDSASITSCRLYIDGSLKTTLTSITLDLSTSITGSVDSEGLHTWNINCTDSGGNIGNSSFRSITINKEGGTGGCSESWICGNWTDCLNEEQIRVCEDANNCGTIRNKPAVIQTCNATIQNITIINETCQEKWQCDWTACEEGYKEPSNCTDLNSCNTTIKYPARKNCACIPNWIDCTNWTECKADYTIDELVEGNISSIGRQYQTCNDDNKCFNTTEFVKFCNLSIDIETKKVEWCDEDYVEIYNKKEGELVSRVKETQIFNLTRVDVNFIIANFSGYCAYCFNGAKDYNETAIDCGGDCPPCGKKGVDIWKYVIWLLWTTVVLLVASYIIYLRKTGKLKIFKKENIVLITPKPGKIITPKPSA